jgi:hypothetical protein
VRRQVTRGADVRTRARAKFAGLGPRGQPITRPELEALIPELSELAGQALTVEDVQAEAERRGLRVVGR